MPILSKFTYKFHQQCSICKCERCERDAVTPNIKNKDYETIEELREHEEEDREEYQKHKECWKTKQKIRELKEVLRFRGRFSLTSLATAHS
jgi:NAD(P)H-nitrite reductase large subunit